MTTRAKSFRHLWNTFLIFVISVMFIVTVVLSFKLLTLDHCFCPSEDLNYNQNYKVVINRNVKKGHKLAVLVPYRDRFEELLEFAPHMHKFLKNQGIQHDIFILNQADLYRFNRASLINVGFLQIESAYDYIAMHDVDLLPINQNLTYYYPEFPHHLAAPELHPRYHYSKFIGGILLINREQFRLVNGLSNRYWGWGLEDDEFYVRLKDSHLNITRPLNITTGTSNTFRHIHGKHRKRDTIKCYNQKEVTRKRDRHTGLHDVQYNLIGLKKITVEDAPVTVFNIELICDHVSTPWCDCTVKKEAEAKRTKTDVI